MDTMKEFAPGTGSLKIERSLSEVLRFERRKSDNAVDERARKYLRGQRDTVDLC